MSHEYEMTLLEHKVAVANLLSSTAERNVIQYMGWFVVQIPGHFAICIFQLCKVTV